MSTSGGIDVVGAVASPWADAVGSPFTLGNAGTTGTLDTNTLGRNMVIQVTANASGNTLTWEASEDGVNWLGFLLSPIGNFGGTAQAFNTTAANAAFVGAAPARFVRARVSTFVGGTLTVAIGFHATPATPPVIGVDTELPAAASLTDATSTPIAPAVGAFGMLWNGATWDRQKSSSGHADGDGGAGSASVASWLFNGSTFDRQRTPNIFKNVTTSALGSTALWTPAAGKKFRLMAYRFTVLNSSAAAAAATMAILLLDAAAATGLADDVLIPAASALTPVGSYTSGWVTLGNGYLSSAANNVLNVNLNVALTAGYVRAVVMGTEE